MFCSLVIMNVYVFTCDLICEYDHPFIVCRFMASSVLSLTVGNIMLCRGWHCST